MHGACLVPEKNVPIQINLEFRGEKLQVEVNLMEVQNQSEPDPQSARKGRVRQILARAKSGLFLPSNKDKIAAPTRPLCGHMSGVSSLIMTVFMPWWLTLLPEL